MCKLREKIKNLASTARARSDERYMIAHTRSHIQRRTVVKKQWRAQVQLIAHPNPPTPKPIPVITHVHKTTQPSKGHAPTTHDSSKRSSQRGLSAPSLRFYFDCIWPRFRRYIFAVCVHIYIHTYIYICIYVFDAICRILKPKSLIRTVFAAGCVAVWRLTFMA